MAPPRDERNMDRYDTWCFIHETFHLYTQEVFDESECVLLSEDPVALREELFKDRKKEIFCRDTHTHNWFVDICWACLLHQTEHAGTRCLTGPTSFTVRP